jgi:hypothetical protein
MMRNISVLKRHAALVDRMASSLGVDLERKTRTGAVSIDELTDAVLRCTDCSNPDHCEARLSAETPVQTAPSFCRNTDFLRALRS